MHGTLTALYNSLGQARTVNTLPLEQYVADTVPGESPSSWGSLGGSGPQGMDWGFQELEAQAIAVRSYVLADLGGYGGYADTCDLDVPDLPRHRVRDPDQRGRRRRHRRRGDGHARRPDRHHRVLGVDGRLHLERQPGVAVHPGARRRRCGVHPRRLQPQPPLDDLGQRRDHRGHVAPDRHVHRLRASPPPTPAIPTTPGTGGWTASRSRAAPRRSPSPARSSTSTSVSTPISSPSPRPAAVSSPSPARDGVTASGWGSGARWATPSARTTARGTGPTRRS